MEVNKELLNANEYSEKNNSEEKKNKSTEEFAIEFNRQLNESIKKDDSIIRE